MTEKILSTAREFLQALLNALRHGWLDSFRELWCKILSLVSAWLRRSRLPGRRAKQSGPGCVPLREPAYRKPDPLIYAQYYLMGLGIAVTWDNPDIAVLRASAEVPPGQTLDADTEYEIVATVRNGSTEAPIVGLPVEFSFLSFGIGTHSNPIGTAKVNLGVKGGPDHPAFARIGWRTPAQPGHYCIQVLLDWADDANPANNLGQKNVNVGTLSSPAVFEFRLANQDANPHAFALEVDAYQIPEPPPCSDHAPKHHLLGPPLSVPERVRAAAASPGVALHRRDNYPLPVGWSVAFLPSHPRLAGGEEAKVTATVSAPAGYRGRQPVNVHAFIGAELVGGVTLLVDGA